MKRYVIVGNGTAGAQAAINIRERDKTGSITIFTRENNPFYYRPKLPEYLSGEVALGEFTMHTLAKYRELNVDLQLGETINAIDPDKKEVIGKRTGITPYDDLLLATGSSCFLPPVDGNDKAGVFTLRTIEDADALKTASKKNNKAILVGGGLLGLEAAHALINLGLSVEVVEFIDRLLPRQLDAESACLLQRQLEGMGFSFHLKARAREITGNDTATGLYLEDGTYLESGIILFSAGVRPNLDLAKQAGLEINKAVIVDQHMRTNVSGIWAAGDIAEFNGQPCGTWPIAMAQGSCAGASMSGELSKYNPRAPSTTLKVAGISLISAGNIEAGNTDKSKTLVTNKVYRKIILEDDVIKGVIFLGSIAGASECIAAMNAGRHLGSLSEKLDLEDFDFKAL